LQPQQAIVNDINAEVINVYQVVRDYPDALIAELEQYRNTASEFYRMRALDRDEKAYAALSAVERAETVRNSV
jgi:DNA adenine methylase